MKKLASKILDALFEALVEGPMAGCDKHGKDSDDTCFSLDTDDKCRRCLVMWHISEAGELLLRPRTRLWESESGSSTCVQFRTDVKPMVWMHTNLGWVPIGNAPEDEKEAETFAEDVAAGYNLVESSLERAVSFL